MRNKVAGIVLAGGYGSFRRDVPKVCESLTDDGRYPMISRVVGVLSDLNVRPILAVVNITFADAIARALTHAKVKYVAQTERVGHGGAVWMCLPVLAMTARNHNLSIENIVVLYGDMPLWHPHSIDRLIDQHLATNGVITMFSISIDREHPRAVGKFGRILRGPNGGIINIKEPWELTDEEMSAAHTVNPSAWVFKRSWLEANVPLLEPRDQGDGFPPERLLPELVAFAAEQGQTVSEMPLLTPWEALGVNTPAELEEVRRLYGKHYNGG